MRSIIYSCNSWQAKKSYPRIFINHPKPDNTMPGDPPLINNKAKQQNTYDAIVVGSGISGGWAAKELCEKGLKVLLLDRGRNLVHGEYPTATKNSWDFPHRLALTERLEEHTSELQSRLHLVCRLL